MEFNPNKQPIFFSTQNHLDIIDIKDDLLILKGNKVSLVIQTNAVNFDLLSEDEQDARIAAFAGLLNSINYPIQIVIRTKKVDITSYVEYLGNFLKQPMSEGRKLTMKIYMNFIKNLIVKNEILDKKFYIVITYGTTSIKNINPLKNIKKTENLQVDINVEALVTQAKLGLYPKKDHILRQLLNMGLTGTQLGTYDLKKIFFDVYN